jgi:hypothetical protein
MSEKLTSAHPLFDPTSLYGQMRATLGAAGKMRGYFHFLWARARHATELAPQEELPDWLSRLAEATPRNEGEALDVWIAEAIFCSTETSSSDRLDAGVIRLCLIREPDGRHTLECRARLAEPGQEGEEASGWAGTSFHCRAFLLEPEVVQRLQSLLQDRPWQMAFLAETVVNYPEVARILAAAPELEGEVRGRDVVFERLPLPDQYDTFPPRRGLLQGVIVCEGSGQRRGVPDRSPAPHRTDSEQP